MVKCPHQIPRAGMFYPFGKWVFGAESRFSAICSHGHVCRVAWCTISLFMRTMNINPIVYQPLSLYYMKKSWGKDRFEYHNYWTQAKTTSLSSTQQHGLRHFNKIILHQDSKYTWIPRSHPYENHASRSTWIICQGAAPVGFDGSNRRGNAFVHMGMQTLPKSATDTAHVKFQLGMSDDGCL